MQQVQQTIEAPLICPRALIAIRFATGNQQSNASESTNALGEVGGAKLDQIWFPWRTGIHYFLSWKNETIIQIP